MYIFVVFHQSINNLLQYMYIKRDISKILNSAVKQFPVVFLTGPRQSGKTTLLKKEFNNYKYINFEDPEIRQWALEQPKDFLKHNKYPAIFDEIQNVPNLFSYIQLIVDEQNRPGLFILSGSQNFLLMQKITQTLAGRSAVLSLLPFCYSELSSAGIDIDTDEFILKGFYPRLYSHINDFELFYKSYINTYVERDVRNLSNIENLNNFIKFMKLCAGRAGQILNISALSVESGISYNTCKSWLSLLEASYVIKLVKPYYKNFNKQIIKKPKIFFTDTGLLSFLLGIHTVETLSIHPLRGNIFENLVFIELLKHKTNLGKDSEIWFWRDNHGTEIDFLLEKNNELSAFEVKSGMNFHKEYLRNLLLFKKYNHSINNTYLVYNGSIQREIEDIQLLNWKNLTKVL